MLFRGVSNWATDNSVKYLGFQWGVKSGTVNHGPAMSAIYLAIEFGTFCYKWGITNYETGHILLSDHGYFSVATMNTFD